MSGKTVFFLKFMEADMEFAKSLSGHDKGDIYLVNGTEQEFVYLVNGTKRTLEEPKKKNKKHVQIIRKLPMEVTDCFAAGVTDLAVKRAIKIYEKLYQ